MNIKQEQQRQLNIRRPLQATASREMPTSRSLPAVFLGVIVNVIDARRLCVAPLKPGESIIGVDWNARDAFEPDEIEVLVTPGQLTFINMPIMCHRTQAKEIIGIVLYNDAGSYQAANPNNHTCVPSGADLLPDLSSGCGTPSIFSGSDCGDG